MRPRILPRYVVILPLLLLLLSGCSTPTPPEAQPTQPSEVGIASSTPAESAPTSFKEELVICASQEPETLIGSRSLSGQAIEAALFGSTATYGDDFGAQAGQLLEGLPSLEDGSLRKNPDETITVVLHYSSTLVWSDGEPVTLDDVIAGLGMPQSPFAPRFEVIDAIKLSDHTLELTAANGAEYPYVPSQPPLPMHILGLNVNPAQAEFTDYAGKPKPTFGAYALDEWVPGSHILLKANPFAATPPVISTVRFRFLSDVQQQQAELESGGCDVLLGDGISAADVSLFADTGSVQTRIYEGSGSAYEQVTFNTQPEPFTNVPFFADARVRQAVALGVDRTTLAQQMVQGLSTVMDSWLPAEHWAYAGIGSLPQYAIDSSAAAALLDSAGWQDQDGDGVREYHGSGGTYTCQRGDWQIEDGTLLSPTLITTADSLRTGIAEKLRTDLAQIGVQLQVQTFPAETLFSVDGPLAHRTFDLALFSASVRPDPDGISRFVGADVFMHPVDLVPVHRWELESRWLTSEQMVERLALNNAPSPADSFQGQNYGAYCNESVDVAVVNASETVSRTEKQSFYAQQQSQVASDVPILPLFMRPRIAVSARYVCGVTIHPYGPLTWNLDRWMFDSTGACNP